MKNLDLYKHSVLTLLIRKTFVSYSSHCKSSVQSDLRLLLFYFITRWDWSKNLALPFQPIRCKTEISCDLVSRVFPRFRKIAFTTCSHWLIMM